MTALKKFEKLEAPGLWRKDDASQLREVYVSFGDTSLVIRNKAEAPLAHWSLPAVVRLNPGVSPALFTTHAEASETLEIEDQTMTQAIETVLDAIARKRPHPGRLRLWIFLGILAMIAALGKFWLPDALQRHTIRVVPPETRVQIGNLLLAEITHLTGNSCSTRAGNRALARLETRLLANPQGHIRILPDGIAKSISLPGGIILLNRKLIEDYEQPEIAAGYVLVENLRSQTDDPLAALLHHAGARASFRLLTTGHLGPDTLKDYASHLLTAERAMPAENALLAAFSGAGFASSGLAYDIDSTGETTLPLIEADPYRSRSYTPLLSDADWVSLQGICGG